MSDGCDTWSREQTLKLINELQKYPCLYDPVNVHFINNDIKHEKLNLILRELKKIKPMVTVEIIKRKIRTLKTQIWRENNKIASSKRSGFTANDVYEPILWCYNELTFLLPCNDSESSSSNLDLSDIGISESEDNSQNVQHTHKKPKTTLARFKKLEEERLGALRLSRTYFENRSAIQPLGKEEEFCRYLCSIIKKIKLEEVFDNLSLEILRLVNIKIREERQQYKNYFTPLSQTQKNSRNTQHSDVLYINSPSPILPTNKHSDDSFQHSDYPLNPCHTSQYPIIYKKPKPYSSVPSTSDLSNDSFQFLKHSQSYLDPTETTSSQDTSDNSLKHFENKSIYPFNKYHTTATKSTTKYRHYPQTYLPSLKGPFKDSLVSTSNPIPINSNQNERPSILKNILLNEPSKQPIHQIKVQSTDTSNQKVLLKEIKPQPPDLLQLAINHVFYDNIIIENYELTDEEYVSK